MSSKISFRIQVWPTKYVRKKRAWVNYNDRFDSEEEAEEFGAGLLRRYLTIEKYRIV